MIQNNFLNGVHKNKARISYMHLAYIKEINRYRTEIAKSKDKSKKHLAKPLTMLEKYPPMDLFKHIIYRCKVLHSLAFFQWRWHNEPRCHIHEIREIFDGKVEFLKENI